MSERKYKYGEPTVLVSGFRVPVSKVQDFKDSAYAKLDSYMNQGKTVLGEVEESENKIDLPNDFVTKITVNKKAKTEMTEREFKIEAVEVVPESRELRKEAKTDYEYQYTFPLGSKAIEIIGHRVFKHHAEEIFYIKLPHGKEFKYAILHSEKEVKDFIRKEIVK